MGERQREDGLESSATSDGLRQAAPREMRRGRAARRALYWNPTAGILFMLGFAVSEAALQGWPHIISALKGRYPDPVWLGQYWALNLAPILSLCFAPFLDRCSPPLAGALGRRTGWIFLFVGLALVNVALWLVPSALFQDRPLAIPSPFGQGLAWISVVVSAGLWIAVDAYRRNIAPPAQQGALFAAQYAGALFGAFLMSLAGAGDADANERARYLVVALAALSLLIGAWAALMADEPAEPAAPPPGARTWSFNRDPLAPVLQRSLLDGLGRLCTIVLPPFIEIAARLRARGAIVFPSLVVLGLSGYSFETIYANAVARTDWEASQSVADQIRDAWLWEYTLIVAGALLGGLAATCLSPARAIAFAAAVMAAIHGIALIALLSAIPMPTLFVGWWMLLKLVSSLWTVTMSGFLVGWWLLFKLVSAFALVLAVASLASCTHPRYAASQFAALALAWSVAAANGFVWTNALLDLTGFGPAVALVTSLLVAAAMLGFHALRDAALTGGALAKAA
jgi:hypothetical protein